MVEEGRHFTYQKEEEAMDNGDTLTTYDGFPCVKQLL